MHVRTYVHIQAYEKFLIIPVEVSFVVVISAILHQRSGIDEAL